VTDAVTESAGIIAKFDAAADAAFDHLRGRPIPDRIFYAASELGNFSAIWHLIGVSRAVVNPSRIADAWAFSAVMGVESLLVNQGVKRLFHRERPAFDGDRPHRLRRPITSSFPSGHASAAFCAAVVLTHDHRALAPVWFTVATAVAVSRVHVKIHHASDIVGGMAVGAVIGLGANVLLDLLGSR
jgi:membrane-associated phospholipid phosphatase